MHATVAYAGVDRFDDRVCGEGWRNEDHRGVGPGLGDGILDGVEDGDVFVELLAALARRDAGDHVSAVLDAPAGVEAALPACNALHEEPRALVHQNTHPSIP